MPDEPWAESMIVRFLSWYLPSLLRIEYTQIPTFNFKVKQAKPDEVKRLGTGMS